MGTRSGNVDPTLILHIMEQEGLNPAQMSHVLHKESGFWGLTGISSDLRDIEEAMEKEMNGLLWSWRYWLMALQSSSVLTRRR